LENNGWFGTTRTRRRIDAVVVAPLSQVRPLRRQQRITQLLQSPSRVQPRPAHRSALAGPGFHRYNNYLLFSTTSEVALDGRERRGLLNTVFTH
jgi:hypothetical protein